MKLFEMHKSAGGHVLRAKGPERVIIYSSFTRLGSRWNYIIKTRV